MRYRVALHLAFEHLVFEKEFLVISDVLVLLKDGWRQPVKRGPHRSHDKDRFDVGTRSRPSRLCNKKHCRRHYYYCRHNHHYSEEVVREETGHQHSVRYYPTKNFPQLSLQAARLLSG